MAVEADEQFEGQEPEAIEQDDLQQDEEGQEPAESEDERDEAGFEGDFDAKRARRTIDKLRGELKKAKQAPKAPDAAETKRENLQLRAALKLGVPEEFASRLRGETVEDMIEDAAALLDALGVRSESEDRAPRREPRRRLSGGSNPSQEPESSAEDVVKAAIGH